MQKDLSATLATHNDQTLFAVDQGGGKSAANILDNVSPTMTCTHGGEPDVAYGFIYEQGAKAGSVGAGEVVPTIKMGRPPAATYANGTETVATHQDQTVFAQQKKVRCFDYEMGAKVGSISYGKISPTIKTRQTPAVVIERSNEGEDDGQ